MSPILVLLGLQVAHATCPVPVTESDLEQSLARAEGASRNEEPLSSPVHAIWRQISCARFPISAESARRVHVVSGIEALNRGDLDMARRHFWSAQELRQGPLELSTEQALQNAWQDIPGSDPYELIRIKGISVLIDRHSARVIPKSRPYLEQHLDGTEIVLSTIRWPDEEIEELRMMRRQAYWALQDLELAWQFLSLRVAAGHRVPGVRLQAVVRSDLDMVREFVRVSEHSLIIDDAKMAASAARKVTDQRWADILAEPWQGLSDEELDLIDLQTIRQRSLATLDSAMRLTFPGKMGTDPRVVSLQTVTTSVYAAAALHTAQHHANRAVSLGITASSLTERAPLPSVQSRKMLGDGLADVALLAVDFSSKPAGSAELLDPFEMVQARPAKGAPAGLAEIDWTQKRSVELKAIDWDDVP